MTEFIKYLQENNFEHGEDLEAEALIVAQKGLYNMGLNFIPEAYSTFLKKYNGIKANGCYLLGATIIDDLDIIDQNKLINKPDKTLLLGYNEFDLLCYDFELKKYKIVDRVDFEVLDAYDDNELDKALLNIVNL